MSCLSDVPEPGAHSNITPFQSTGLHLHQFENLTVTYSDVIKTPLTGKKFN